MSEKKPAKKIVIIVSAALFLVLAGFAGGYRYARETPRYSLYQLKRALLARDVDGALRYMDVDSVADHAADRFLAKINKKRDGTGENMEGTRTKDFMEQLVPAIKKDLKRQMKDLVATYLEDEGMLQNIRKASIWIFEITLGNDNTAEIKADGKRLFVMTKTPDGFWRISEIIFE